MYSGGQNIDPNALSRLMGNQPGATGGSEGPSQEDMYKASEDTKQTQNIYDKARTDTSAAKQDMRADESKVDQAETTQSRFENEVENSARSVARSFNQAEEDRISAGFQRDFYLTNLRRQLEENSHEIKGATLKAQAKAIESMYRSYLICIIGVDPGQERIQTTTANINTRAPDDNQLKNTQVRAESSARTAEFTKQQHEEMLETQGARYEEDLSEATAALDLSTAEFMKAEENEKAAEDAAKNARDVQFQLQQANKTV